MSHDAFNDRRIALEEQFFKQHDEELVQKMKDSAQKVAARHEIQALTGISNDQVLEALAGLKIGGGPALLVMSMLPVVEVAWADGEPNAAERKAVLDIAASVGIKTGTSAYGYLERWLTEKPGPNWHDLWEAYTRSLVALMKPEDKAMLKNTVVGRARVVAEASGGFLGVAWLVSEAEKAVLAKVERAFS